MVRPALIAPPFEMIESQIVFELPILLLDRPTTALECHEIAQGRGGGEMQQIVFLLFGAERSHSNQRSPRPFTGRTRRATKSAVSGPCVPAPHVTETHACFGAEAAKAVAVKVPETSATVNVASPRVATPYASPSRSRPARNAAVLPSSASATTPVSVKPVFRTVRTCAKAMRHFSRNRTVGGGLPPHSGPHRRSTTSAGTGRRPSAMSVRP